MPEHANTHGNVHGGHIMKMCDEAAAICAMRHAQRPAVTVAIDSMTFHSPVHVGELISLSAHVSYVGTTSMEISVKVTAEDPIQGKTTHTNSAYFVFVALDDKGAPCRVPGLLIESEEQRMEFEAGKLRQQQRVSRGS